MNILLLCSKENLLGNKLVICSTLYCNDNIDWYVCLIEDIGKKEKQKLIDLVTYIDCTSTITFEELNEEQSLEDQFYYLNDFLYIAADCITTQTIEFWNFSDDTLILPIQNKNLFNQRHCVFYLNLADTRAGEKQTYIKYNNEFITNLIFDIQDINYFDSRIGFNGKFSFYYNMPIIFWFDNQTIYKINLEEWLKKYPEFEYFIDQIFLVETIQF